MTKQLTQGLPVWVDGHTEVHLFKGYLRHNRYIVVLPKDGSEKYVNRNKIKPLTSQEYIDNAMIPQGWKEALTGTIFKDNGDLEVMINPNIDAYAITCGCFHGRSIFRITKQSIETLQQTLANCEALNKIKAYYGSK